MFRAILFGVAIVAGGLASWLSLASQPSVAVVVNTPEPAALVDVLVAADDIDVGMALGTDNMQWQPWPVDAVKPNFVTREDRPEAMTELSGQITLGQISGGELILTGKFASAEDVIVDKTKGPYTVVVRRAIRTEIVTFE